MVFVCVCLLKRYTILNNLCKGLKIVIPIICYMQRIKFEAVIRGNKNSAIKIGSIHKAVLFPFIGKRVEITLEEKDD